MYKKRSGGTWLTLFALLKSPRTRLGAAVVVFPSLPMTDDDFEAAAFPDGAVVERTAAEEETLASMLEGREPLLLSDGP